MSIDAMKQALTALGEIEWSNNSQWQADRARVAITTLRLAIEQAERQESYWQEEARRYAGNADFWREKAKRQPLTEEEIEALARYEDKHGQGPWHLAFARAIERKHGIGGGE